VNRIYLLFCSLFFLIPILAEDVTLGWDPSADATVIGYKLYYGVQGTDPQILTLSTNQVTVTNLVKGTSYFFYVTAFNADGLESAPSDTIEYTIPFDPLDSPILSAPVLSGSGFMLSGFGAVWQEYMLQSTADIATPNWSDLFPVMSDDTGLIEVVLAPNEPRQFYRLIVQ